MPRDPAPGAAAARALVSPLNDAVCRLACACSMPVDFFNAAVNAKLLNILLALCVMYTFTIVWWATTYYITWR